MSKPRGQADLQQKKESLERSRENQRRSRKKRKEYISELEARVRELELKEKQASVEYQIAARKVDVENIELREEILRLRQVLRGLGLNEAEIEPQSAPRVASHRPSGPGDVPTSPTTTLPLSAAGEELRHLLNRSSQQSTSEASETLSPTRALGSITNPLPGQVPQSANVGLTRMDSAREEAISARPARHPAIVTSSRSSFSEGGGPADEYNSVSQADPSSLYQLSPQHQEMYGMTPVNQYSLIPRWQGAPTYQGVPHTQAAPIAMSQRVPTLGSLHGTTSPIHNVAPNLHTQSSTIHQVVSLPPPPIHNHATSLHGPTTLYGQVPQTATGPTLQSAIPVSRNEQHNSLNYQTTTGFPPGGSQPYG